MKDVDITNKNKLSTVYIDATVSRNLPKCASFCHNLIKRTTIYFKFRLKFKHWNVLVFIRFARNAISKDAKKSGASGNEVKLNLSREDIPACVHTELHILWNSIPSARVPHQYNSSTPAVLRLCVMTIIRRGTISRGLLANFWYLILLLKFS